jgi:hypothetical protein
MDDPFGRPRIGFAGHMLQAQQGLIIYTTITSSRVYIETNGAAHST